MYLPYLTRSYLTPELPSTLLLPLSALPTYQNNKSSHGLPAYVLVKLLGFLYNTLGIYPGTY